MLNSVPALTGSSGPRIARKELTRRSRGSALESKLKTLDYTSARRSDIQGRFRASFEEKVETLDANWNLTEIALKETAVEVIPTLKGTTLGTWHTPEATAELGSLIKQSAECRRLLSLASPNDVSQLRVRKRSLKKAIRKCVEKHKKIYRRHLVDVAIRVQESQPTAAGNGQACEGV